MGGGSGQVLRPGASMAESHVRRVSARRFLARVALTSVIAGGLVAVPSLGTPAFASTQGSQIVSIAKSQIGVKASPYGTYCNPYSAYWHVGSDCGNGNRAMQWCADFVAWAWARAGITGLYGHGINAAASSFETWGKSTGRWHPIGDGYAPQPGDAVEYSNQHVGIYV